MSADAEKDYDPVINNNITDAYSCDGCGAPLVYKPGSSELVCKHCGSTRQIAQEETIIEELDFDSHMATFIKESIVNTKVIICSNCKATPIVNENLRSMMCPYCGSPLVESAQSIERYIKPEYVVPFQIDRKEINAILTKWAKSRYFAPNKLKRAVLDPLNLHGIYMPYWTYDANTETNYTGQRGDAYYVTVGSGDKKRTVRRVRWSFASGTIRNFYDDILISGSTTLDYELLSKVNNWNAKNILKINDSYLAGFITEKYQVDLKDGFIHAKHLIETSERSNVKYAIGGDEQRISSMDTRYSNITFKHILFPIYVSSFQYKNKLYTFYINGSTAKIAGKRPYSAMKITLAIIAGILLIAGIYFLGVEKH